MKINKSKKSEIFDIYCSTLLRKEAIAPSLYEYDRHWKTRRQKTPGEYAETYSVESPAIFRRLTSLAGLINASVLFSGIFGSIYEGLTSVSDEELTNELEDLRDNHSSLSSGLQSCLNEAQRKSNIPSLEEDIRQLESIAPQYQRILDAVSSGEFDPDSLDLNSEEGRENAETIYTIKRTTEETCEKIFQTTNSSKNTRDSINKADKLDMFINKKADTVSDQYYKDAITGLNSEDSLMQTFYKEMSAEYNKEQEVKVDKRKDLMDFFYEQEHIMLQAHPDSIVVADAMGAGGIVENNVERHNFMKDVAKKRPSGNFTGNHN